MQVVSRQNIDNWLRENEYTYGNLAVKRQDKPKQPKPKVSPKRQRIRPPWYQRDPENWFKPVFRVLVWMHDHLLDIAKMAVACAIGVVLGLLFVWAW